MARYFLHLRDGTDETLDEEGLEFESLEAMRDAVLAAARDLIGADAHKGMIDFRFRIDAENDEGQIVYTLPFEHAVSVIPASEPERDFA
jgi:hypothetical protein